MEKPTSLTIFKTMFSYSNQFAIIADLNCVIKNINPVAVDKAQAVLGKRLKPGNSFLELVPEDQQDVFDACFKSASSGQVASVVLSTPGLDLTRYWVQWNITPILNADNQVTQMYLEGIDITQFKLTELELKKREAQLQRVLSSISDHIYMTEITDTGERLNHYLSPTENLTGYPLSRLLDDWNFWPSTIIHPDDRALAAMQAKRLANGQNSEVEYRLVRADGQVIWVRDSGRAEQDPAGNSTVVFGVVSDITHRKRLENQLQTIYQLGQELTLLYNEQDIIRRMLGAVSTVIRFDYAGCGLVNPARHHLNFTEQLSNNEFTETNFSYSLDSVNAPAVQAVLTGRTLHDSDTPAGKDSRQVALYVPLKQGKQILGVIGVHRTGEAFSLDDEQLLQVLAGNTAGALINARLHKQSKRWAEQLSLLHELGRAITGTLSSEKIYQALAKYSTQLLPYDYMAITIMEKRNTRTLEISSDGQITAETENKFLPPNSAINWVIAKDQSLLHTEIGTKSNFSEDSYFVDQNIKSIMIIPLRAKGKVFGAWSVGTRQTAAYDTQNLAIAESVAGHLAGAIENARLFTQIQQRFSQISALNMIGQAVNSTLDLNETLKIVTDYTLRLLNAGGVSLILVDERREDLWFAAISGDKAQKLQNKRLSLGQGIVGWVIEHGKAELVTNAAQDPRFYNVFDKEFGYATQSVLCTPLKVKDKIIGAIEVINKATGAFSYEDLNLLTLLAAPAGTAIENAQLYERERDQYRQLQQSQMQLIQVEKMAALGRLAASLAHEINNPLQSIDSCFTLVDETLANSPLQQKVSRYLAMAAEEIERIAGIVNRMREFYRPSKPSSASAHNPDIIEDFYHSVTSDFANIDLHDILESVLSLTNKQFQHNQIIAMPAWMDNLPTIQGNSSYLKQVFLNLVLNAIDAMPGGGELRIKTSPDKLEVMTQAIPAIRIECSDTGPGISQKELQHVFEPLFTTKEKGSGLGLYTTQKIIEAHHGKISVHSQTGQGTTFVILLPVEQPQKGIS